VSALTEQRGRLSLLDAIETDVNVVLVTVDDGKLRANGFPRKSLDGLLDFYAVYRNQLFSHVEDFKIEVHSLKDLLHYAFSHQF
jgi:hypothetical protein